LESANPGSFVTLEKFSNNRFRRLFLCFGASATGFESCRPVLGLDGTHLKSKFQGILLTATATDARGSLFPLAFGVVDAENDENWRWFLNNLHHVLEKHIPDFLKIKFTLTFLSNRQKGLIGGVETIFPEAAHGCCLKHLEVSRAKWGPQAASKA